MAITGSRVNQDRVESGNDGLIFFEERVFFKDLLSNTIGENVRQNNYVR